MHFNVQKRYITHKKIHQHGHDGRAFRRTSLAAEGRQAPSFTWDQGREGKGVLRRDRAHGLRDRTRRQSGQKDSQVRAGAHIGDPSPGRPVLQSRVHAVDGASGSRDRLLHAEDTSHGPQDDRDPLGHNRGPLQERAFHQAGGRRRQRKPERIRAYRGHRRRHTSRAHPGAPLMPRSRQHSAAREGQGGAIRRT